MIKIAENMTDRWLHALGYDGSVGVIYRSASEVLADHPYAREVDLMLRQDGEICSSAVFTVDRVPTVCFIAPSSDQAADPHFVDEVRRKIWNQNLVSIVIVIQDDRADIQPAPRNLDTAESLTLIEASVDGPFSATEVASGQIYSRLPEWFNRKHRLDRVLLDNLSETVKQLQLHGLTQEQAQLLVGKCIFVSYLEDREIVAERYRAKRKVERLLTLLQAKDGQGLDRLFRQLKSDLNGDFLEIENGANVDWRSLSAPALDCINDFLHQTDARSGQRAFWAYNFKYIPVELISGIYESFLASDQRKKQGAVYTPRHLAALAVDEAFSGSKTPWKEIVLDGACGSGILLTCAYRRMLGAATAHKKQSLTYHERQDILLAGIRGGDISAAACKVTVFSLYLALLEDLAPSDIGLLQEDHNIKLPKLLGRVITAEKKGDFFAPDNAIAQPESASIVISNPPWFEPEGDGHIQPYETWWRDRFGQPLPRRQIALAFSRKSTDALKPGGKLCIILPASTLGASDSAMYLKNWFQELKPQRIYNLADMRHVLFDGAVHPTAVISGTKRPSDSGRIPPLEMCDYLVPKADISLAFGRLTVHSADRKRLYVNAICLDSEVLRTYLWGNELDEGLIARLRLIGTLRSHAEGKTARFVICKGFHLTDNSKAPIKATPLRHYDFLSTAVRESRYPKDRLYITSQDVIPFPSNIKYVADLGSKNGQAFEGVRVIFPDGADMQTLEVRACYTDQPLCFTQTVGAIIDQQGDKKLMQFLAVYLRSTLARYLLFYTTYSLTMERPHVKVREVGGLPFPLPDEHPDPALAKRIIQQAVELLKPYKRATELLDNRHWTTVRKQLDKLVFEYFGLTATEQRVVNETCEYFIPSRQPTTFNVAKNPLRGGPTAADIEQYSRVLCTELEDWRERFEGKGFFHVELLQPASKSAGAIAIVRMSIQDHESRVSTRTSDNKKVRQIMDELRGSDIFPRVGDDTVSMVSDFIVHHDGDLYLVKPLIKRLWLVSAAAHDAYRIVQVVRCGEEVH